MKVIAAAALVLLALNSSPTICPSSLQAFSINNLIECIEQKPSATAKENVERIDGIMEPLISRAESETLAEMKDVQLRNAFKAADAAIFYTLRRSYLESFMNLYGELQRRSLDERADAVSVLGALIQLRDFSSAASFAAGHEALQSIKLPEFKPLPTELRDSGPTYWTYEHGQLTERLATLKRDLQVVVIAHPDCAFSRQAIRAIERDPVLTKAFEDSLWLAPQDRRLATDMMDEWNKSRSFARIGYINDQWSWPLPHTRSTPLFYFLVRGEVIESLEGWPDDEQANRLGRIFDRLKRNLENSAGRATSENDCQKKTAYLGSE